MKRILMLISFILLSGLNYLFSQTQPDVSVYLLTCGPGTETYSIYGHCAMRIVKPAENSDLVYNWGVFDFSTKNFAWKFAKGRLYYMLDTDSYEEFLRMYFYEQRWVQSQKINLEPEEISTLLELVSENLKPENVKYLYDFFYDNCATRIRDLLEKSLGNKIVYPPQVKKELQTFREELGQYEHPYPWLKTGIDLIMGTPGDKKAIFRDKMFLPLELQAGLSELVINRNGKMIPLLQNSSTVIEFESPNPPQHFLTTPLFIFSLLLVVLIVFFALVKNRRVVNIADMVIFSIFSLLSVMMLFFNFFTDHDQMNRNLNIIWLSPIVFLCLAAMILNREWIIWFRIVFALSIISFGMQLIAPGAFNNAFIPVILLLALRSSARAGFSWNPLSVDSF
jgi:hypothetical protein